jgi:hypothetical protein
MPEWVEKYRCCYDASMRTLALALASTALLGLGRLSFAADECAGFEWDMTHELGLLKAQPTPVTALAALVPDARPVPLEQRLDVDLLPAKQVRLEVPPRREPAADTHAGLVRIHVPRTAGYRVSASERLWIEVVGPGGVVASTKFTMSGTCPGLRKSVVFPLEGETDYWIQLSGSPAAQATLLVTADR